MELDLQSLFGFLCIQLYSLADTPQLLPYPRNWAHIRGLYWTLVSQDRRHLFVAPWFRATSYRCWQLGNLWFPYANCAHSSICSLFYVMQLLTTTYISSFDGRIDCLYIIQVLKKASAGIFTIRTYGVQIISDYYAYYVRSRAGLPWLQTLSKIQEEV